MEHVLRPGQCCNMGASWLPCSIPSQFPQHKLEPSPGLLALEPSFSPLLTHLITVAADNHLQLPYSLCPQVPLPSSSDFIPSSALPTTKCKHQTLPSPGHLMPSFSWSCAPIHNMFEHPSPMDLFISHLHVPLQCINLQTCWNVLGTSAPSYSSKQDSKSDLCMFLFTTNFIKLRQVYLGLILTQSGQSLAPLLASPNRS